LLQKASSVMAVTIGSSNASRPDLSDLARYLSRAGVHIEADTIPAEGHVSTQLMQQAKAINAAYIVMGAYSRSRLLETILGGETQRMLAQDEIAVLFAH
ncbi:MAG: universal stress protein, partial [Pseudomonadota bacterium]